MILAIRAFRATIFAFNASIWVSRPALASVTVAVAEIVAPLAAVAVTVNEPGVTGANTVAVAADVDDADFPPT